MSHLYLDIETLPANLSPAEIRGLAADSVPANYKDPAKIEAWIEEHGAEAHHRTALDSMRGRILMLAWAVDDAPVESVYLDDPDDPRPVLDALAGALRGLRSVVWVGHNIAAFDLPYLRRAALRLRHPVARAIPSARFSPVVADTMAMWAGTDPRPAYVSLEAIATFLGLGAKAGGMDGSQVYGAWKDGRHEDIRRYGERDVALVRDVHRTIVGPTLDSA